MTDLVLKHGQVIDPASGYEGRQDIAVTGTSIVQIAPEIDAGEARRVLDVAGKVVAPGLVDLHAHVYWGVTTEGASDLNAPAELVGVRSGVTTLVDGGSAGDYNLGGLARYVVPATRTRLFAFLNLYRTGLFLGPAPGEDRAVDLEKTIGAIQAHRPLIQGVKLIWSGAALKAHGLDAVRLAVQVARETGTRLMIHIGDLSAPPDAPPGGEAADLTREMLGMLAPGDIVTHVCTPRPGGLLDEQGRVWPELLDARSRGVVLDSAHGRTNLSFQVARRLLDQGIVPDVISSDLTLGGRSWIVHSLTECMSKFLALGLSLAEVIRMATSNPARALGMADRLGALAVGREADLSVLDVVEGEWQFTDSLGRTLRGTKALVPAVTVRAGEVIAPDWGPHPWGWLPAPGPGPAQAD